MKILVTGANGYIGSKVVESLLNFGIEVIAVDFKCDHIDSRAHIIIDNIFEEQNPYEKYGKPDVCLHLAWRDGFNHNSINHMKDLSNHFMFIKRLVDSKIKQIAVMGSMHEAGYYEGKIDTLEYTNPTTLYGIAKDALRRSLKKYCENSGVLFQWLRAFYMYGNDDFGNSIFCKIRQAANEGKKTFPFTKGTNKYDFLFVDNLVRQISYAIMQSDVLGEINICSGTPISLAEQVEKYISDNGLNIELEYGKYPDRPYDSPCVYGDNTKIKKILDKEK